MAVYYIKILINEISNSLKISSIKIQQHQQPRFEEKARDIEKNIVQMNERKQEIEKPRPKQDRGMDFGM